MKYKSKYGFSIVLCKKELHFRFQEKKVFWDFKSITMKKGTLTVSFDDKTLFNNFLKKTTFGNVDLSDAKFTSYFTSE